ncbi:FKBP-type peptidyl-prolyl cis-trans isomerase [Saccharospirillum salsuginis]|uniref:Peptidyl-prolyl cis-trans isomerase n=2 Tax=Saccharospirillum salsuginis TaxID=418750 RepID=A0A918KGS5_9GAMM|nr:FKBP-type peptidyl-prolyl cis-trans isomerase [Saccharospirillum salsuginis]GGX62362.1 peptidyl-prolyl cis-trans isomerase [Saccharospirillum salsuginis]
MQLKKLKTGLLAGACALTMAGYALAEDTALETDEQVASYGIGYGFATNLKQQTQGLDLDVDALVAGLRAAMAGEESELSNDRINAAIQTLQQQQQQAQAEQQAQQQAKAEETKAAGQEFLAENSERDEVSVTDSGLQYEVLSETDSGASPTAQDTVRVHYHGTLIDGTVFDSSVDRGEPIEFPLSGVIKGWTEGVQLMTEGDKYKFYIPSELAYGSNSPSPSIPAGSTLIFEVELLEVIASEGEGGDGEG